MDTLSPAHTCHHARIRLVTTRPTDFVDLTDHLTRVLAEAGVETGVVNVQTTHTTTAVIVNEGEPLLLDDLRQVVHVHGCVDEAAKLEVRPTRNTKGRPLVGTGPCVCVTSAAAAAGRPRAAPSWCSRR